MKKRTNVVTGAAGFLGSNLVEELCRRGENVVGFDNLSRGKASAKNLLEIQTKANGFHLIVGNILDFERVKNVIRDGVDVVYHFAALPSHRLALNWPHDYTMTDLAGTANILEAVRLCSHKPLVVFASSNKVYGKQECPWKEDKLPQPEGPYAVAKWASEKLCEMYNKYFDVPCVIPRYHHVAGPRSNPDLALSIFVEGALIKMPVEVHGKFVNKKFVSCSADYTHVEDAIRATLLMVDKYKKFEIYNVANKKLTSVLKMAEYVAKKLNPKLEIKKVKILDHETLKHHSNVSKAEKQLGFVASIPVEKAIDDYIEWRSV